MMIEKKKRIQILTVLTGDRATVNKIAGVITKGRINGLDSMHF